MNEDNRTLQELEAALEAEREKLFDHMKKTPFIITEEDALVMRWVMEYERYKTRMSEGFYRDHPESLDMDKTLVIEALRDEVITLQNTIREMRLKPPGAQSELTRLFLEVL